MNTINLDPATAKEKLQGCSEGDTFTCTMTVKSVGPDGCTLEVDTQTIEPAEPSEEPEEDMEEDMEEEAEPEMSAATKAAIGEEKTSEPAPKKEPPAAVMAVIMGGKKSKKTTEEEE